MTAPRMANQVLDNVAEIAEKAKDLTAKVKERLDDTYHDLDRTVRRAKGRKAVPAHQGGLLLQLVNGTFCKCLAVSGVDDGHFEFASMDAQDAERIP